jgi:leader peptidase (prepilin peptidase)/N-methyltransferase
MQGLAFVAAFGFGAIVGSFLNVCIFRLPDGESVVFPGSHCRSCKKPLGWYDNVPLLSFIFLRGHCRHCKSPISRQYFLIEIVTALLFVLFYHFFGPTPTGGIYLVFSMALLVAGVIDLRHRIIPDEITLPGIVLGLGLSALVPTLHGQETWVRGLGASFLGAAIGGGFLYLAGTAAEKILKKEAMGGGDVKLLAMIGAFIGWSGVFWTIFFSSLLGSVAGIYMRLKKGEQYVPYGPYLALAAFMYLFFGSELIRLYWKWLGA